MKKPHDPTDLLLSPIAIAIDERLEEYAKLSAAALSSRITWETNSQPRDSAEAAQALVASLTYLLDTHGWEVRWDPRGIRMHHGDHDVVLGVPTNLVRYVDTAGHAPSASYQTAPA